MKNSQKLLVLLATVVLAVATLAFAACGDKPETVVLDNLELPEMNDNQAAIIIKNRNDTYTVHIVTVGENGTNATTVEGVLSYLNENNLLQFEASDGWLSDINNLNPDSAAREFISLYTSVQSDWDLSADSKSYQIGDVTVTTSAYGIAEMKIQAGALIYFELQTW